jgi:hypothetical protein
MPERPDPDQGAESGCSRSDRQRERMVGKSRPGVCESTRNSDRFGRLLENLEKGIGGIAVEIIGRINDRNPPIAGPGGLAEELSRLSDLVDGDH